MAEEQVKFIVRGRFVSPEGKDLGPAETEQAEAEQEAGEEGSAAPKPRTRKPADKD